jgi:hypothetical protein
VAGRPHAWPAGRPFAPNRPFQVGGDSPLPLYKTPMAEDSITHTTCSSPLVKVLV